MGYLAQMIGYDHYHGWKNKFKASQNYYHGYNPKLRFVAENSEFLGVSSVTENFFFLRREGYEYLATRLRLDSIKPFDQPEKDIINIEFFRNAAKERLNGSLYSLSYSGKRKRYKNDCGSCSFCKHPFDKYEKQCMLFYDVVPDWADCWIGEGQYSCNIDPVNMKKFERLYDQIKYWDDCEHEFRIFENEFLNHFSEDIWGNPI